MQEIVPNISRPKIFVNRELSWMEFNLRVLSESLNPKIPLMERLKFLSIYFSNLDEFFMVRVGSLHDQSIVEPDKLDDKTGLNAADQIDAILNKANQINPIAQKAWESICLELRNQDIDILDLHHLSKLDEQIVQKYFSEEMRPLLSPQIIDRQHPFPFLKNKESFIVSVLESKDENICLGIVPFSQLPPYFIFNINQRRKILFTADVLLHFAQKLFGKQKIQEKHVMRVTRNADISVDEGLFDFDIDFRGVMTEMLKKRRRLDVVRLQFSSQPGEKLSAFLCKKLKVSPNCILVRSIPLDFSFGFALPSALDPHKDKKQWYYHEAKPFVPVDFANGDGGGAINYLQNHDLLRVFHSTAQSRLWIFSMKQQMIQAFFPSRFLCIDLQITVRSLLPSLMLRKKERKSSAFWNCALVLMNRTTSTTQPCSKKQDVPSFTDSVIIKFTQNSA